MRIHLQRLARLGAVARRKVMDERNAKRRVEVRPKAIERRVPDEPFVSPYSALLEPDFDDLCNWYNTGDECQVVPRGVDDE